MAAILPDPKLEAPDLEAELVILKDNSEVRRDILTKNATYELRLASLNVARPALLFLWYACVTT